jgi:hypothetical protein
MSQEDADIFLIILKQSGKKAIKSGVNAVSDNDELEVFLARQFSFVFDLLKKGEKITIPNLTILLAEKAGSIADLGMGERNQCAVSLLLLSLSLVKTAAFTTFTGPAHLAVKAIEILADMYSVDKSCGVTNHVRKTVNNAVGPAASWLETGVMQALSRGSL